MTELPTALYDLVARLDHAAAVYNWPDCTEAAREIESLHAEVERLRALIKRALPYVQAYAVIICIDEVSLDASETAKAMRLSGPT